MGLAFFNGSELEVRHAISQLLVRSCLFELTIGLGCIILCRFFKKEKKKKIF